MTQKMKLEIIGPYTPEHEGPFCTRGGRSVRLLTRSDGSKEFPIVGFVKNEKTPSVWTAAGDYFASGSSSESDLMNAREAPVAREFWVNEYAGGGLSVYSSKEEAENYKVCLRRTIHAREVLPGDDL